MKKIFDKLLQIGPYAEVLYYLVGIAGIITIVFCVIQYLVSRKDRKSDKKNQQTEKAINLLYTFNKTVYSKYLAVIKNNSNIFHLNHSEYVSEDERLFTKGQQYLDSLDEEEIEKLRELFIELEYFSSTYVNCDCDNKIIRKSIEKKFLSIFDCVCPIMLNKEDFNSFKNASDIYNTWKSETAKMLKQDELNSVVADYNRYSRKDIK